MSATGGPPNLIRQARRTAGITQAALAQRLGMTQPQVARLESRGANPTLRTLERVMEATGHRLVLARDPRRSRRPALPDGDEAQIRRHLAMSPAERLRAHDASRRNVAAMVSRARPVPRDDG